MFNNQLWLRYYLAKTFQCSVFEDAVSIINWFLILECVSHITVGSSTCLLTSFFWLLNHMIPGSWQEYYKSVFFPKAEWWVAELLFLSLNNWGLNNWGLNFLLNECSQSSQIYLSPEKLRKTFTFQSCKFLNDKIDRNTNFAKLPSAK